MMKAQHGVVYLWALFAVTVAGIVLAGTGQVWQITIQREKEKELLFIGEQFRKAIMSYYNNPLTGIRQYPEKLEELLEDKRGAVPIRHLRKIYIDPMTLTDEWGLVIEEPPQQQQAAPQSNNPANAANLMGANVSSPVNQVPLKEGIAGVYSLSTKKPRKKDNFPDQYASFSDADTYQDWQFVFKQQSGTGTNNQQQGQQGGTGQPGTAPSSSPFGGTGTPRPGQGGQGGLGGLGGQGGGFGGQGGASPTAPPATGQNPFAR